MKMIKKYIGLTIALFICSIAVFAAKVDAFCTSGASCQGQATKNLNESGVCPACVALIEAETQYAWEEKEAEVK